MGIAITFISNRELFPPSVEKLKTDKWAEGLLGAEGTGRMVGQREDGGAEGGRWSRGLLEARMTPPCKTTTPRASAAAGRLGSILRSLYDCFCGNTQPRRPGSPGVRVWLFGSLKP